MRVGGHSNTYHTRSAEEAWAGIAAAGYRTVELTAVVGWTEHVDLDADPAELFARLAHYGLERDRAVRALRPDHRRRRRVRGEGRRLGRDGTACRS